MKKDDPIATQLLKMMASDREVVIDKVGTSFYTLKNGVQIGRVCSRRLNRLVKSGNIGKSNVGDIHVFVSE